MNRNSKTRMAASTEGRRGRGAAVAACNFLCVLCALLFIGCSTAPLTHGIPNFAQVDYTIARGGQPTIEGWVWLASQGYTNVIKLNTDEEGSDAAAEAIGMTVQRFPISLTDQIFYLKHRDLIWGAVDAIKPHTYIHCEHGQDRTGLVVAVWRVDSIGYDANIIAMAQNEMLAHGFHKSLFGLWNFWEGLTQ